MAENPAKILRSVLEQNSFCLTEEMNSFLTRMEVYCDELVEEADPPCSMYEEGEPGSRVGIVNDCESFGHYLCDICIHKTTDEAES